MLYVFIVEMANTRVIRSYEQTSVLDCQSKNL